ncbi:cupin domain-containing protein [Nocardiopsis sp. NPDC050513]|uniref:cupin domain-containing protein n=1 Tax=Nocardiopsis sp. NPDC050513 TaxID=3364338 RepID=UPI00379A30E7
MTAAPVVKVSEGDVQPDRRRGGEVRVLLSPRTVTSTSGFGGTLTLGPGEFVCEHTHPYSEEFVYVVRGGVVMRVGDEEIELRAGDALMVPIGERHRVRNPGSEPAHVVFHLGPLAPRPELGHVDLEHLPTAPEGPTSQVGGVR